jgi:hypothetical protein
MNPCTKKTENIKTHRTIRGTRVGGLSELVASINDGQVAVFQRRVVCERERERERATDTLTNFIYADVFCINTSIKNANNGDFFFGSAKEHH